MDTDSGYLYVYGNFGISRLQVSEEGIWTDPSSWPEEAQPIWFNNEPIDAPYVTKMIQKSKDVFLIGQFKNDGNHFYKEKCITLFDFAKSSTL